MRGLTIICLMLLALLTQGCAPKIKTEYVYIKPKIDNEILRPESVIFREVLNQTDSAILILDLYEALENCNNKLEKIKELNE